MGENKMENLNVELSPAMIAFVPIVAAIIQMLKRIPHFEKFKEWLPFFSMVIAWALLYYQGVQNPILPAVMIGLTACGGYDLLKGKVPK